MFYVFVGASIIFCFYWGAQILFAIKHKKYSMTLIDSDEQDLNTPVSIIHPIKDLDFELEKNLDSWMKQNYKGKVEHIFSFQDPNDPAIPVVKELMSKYPDIDYKIIVNPVMQGLNGKSSNMVHGVRQSKYDMLLFIDSDIRVMPDFIVKMIRPLKDENTGITTCGQINTGGKDFWTRFFTFMQNTETDFMWAMFTKIGMDVGATGAAFAMRKDLLMKIGGLEAFGGSLLEDLHLGNTLYKMGYKIFLGPFIECHVDKLGKEKSFNYAKRIATGIKAHIALELPAFVLMLFWYWIILFAGIIMSDSRIIYLGCLLVLIRMIHSALTRKVTGNKLYLKDLIMGPMLDMIGTFYLIFAKSVSSVEWRGIKYDVKAGGFINDGSISVDIEEDKLDATLKD